jgi:hypothetical protein
MRRVTSAVCVAGLSLMSVVGFVPGGSARVTLESQILVFLAGLFLLVLGGLGYAGARR